MIIFSFFFAERIVKSAIESLGRLVVGAKVEITELNLSFSRLSLKIKGLSIGNKDDEWHNLFEVGEIRFQVGLKQLLEKKIWIEDIAVENIKFDTLRAISAKLPPPLAGQSDASTGWLGEQNIIAQEIQNRPVTLIIQKEKKVDLNTIIPASDGQLTALPAIKNTETMLNAQHQNNQGLLSKLNITNRVADIKAQLNTVNLNEKDPLKIQAELKKLKEIKKSIDVVNSEVNQTATQLRTDYQTIDNALSEIDRLKEKDYQSIMNLLDVQNVNQAASGGEIARLVFGPEWLERSKTFLYWLDKLQFFLPPPQADKKDDPLKKRSRVKGTYITFPRQKSYPGFFLKQAVLSTVRPAPSALGGQSGNEPTGFTFQGKITDISSNPALTGQPLIISLEGQNPNFNFTGTINHIPPLAGQAGNIGRASFQLIITDTNISGFALGQSSWLPKKIAGGRADLNMQMMAEGDEITLTIDIFPRNLSFDAADIPSPPPTGQSGNIVREIASFLTTTQNLQINGKISGRKGERLKFQISSNIDELLAQEIRKQLEAQLEEVKRQVRERINQLVDEPRTRLVNQVQQKRNEMDTLIKEKESAVAEVNNIARDHLEKMEKKTRESLQDKLKEKLKIPK